MGRDTAKTRKAAAVLGRKAIHEYRATRVIGQRFGSIVPLSIVENGKTIGFADLLCQCDCGNTRVFNVSRFYKQGKLPKSCGCHWQKQAVEGEWYGFLQAISAPYYKKNLVGNSKRVLCRCYCGRERERFNDWLVSDEISPELKTCGCTQRKDARWLALEYRGRQSGMLTVAGVSKGSVLKLICKCICGSTARLLPDEFSSGKHMHCGCCTDRDQVEIAWAAIVHINCKSALQRGIEWGLASEEALACLRGKCFYCGVAFSMRRRLKRFSLLYNGIDRVDNEKGYIPGNVVSACSMCNLAKRTHSKECFLDWVKRVAFYNGLLK